MKRRAIIKKVLILSAWLLIGSSMIVLLAAANNKQHRHFCKGLSVSIKGPGDKFFVDKGDITKQFETVIQGSVINQPLVNLHLAKLEKALERHAWIKDAELYVDSKDVLHVAVWEREPIARVFTTLGNSFFIDSAGKRMPLLDKVNIRVPVITNFTPARRLSKRDSAVLNEVKWMAQYIVAHPFWNAQIAQIDIRPGGGFELVPVVGNHIIRVGRAENFEEKLSRLFLFYRQVMSKTGFDTYSVIDVQFDGQVIGSKNNSASGIDSIQLEKNIKDLIERSKLQSRLDSLAVVEKSKAPVADTLNKKAVVLPVTSPPKKTGFNPARPKTASNPEKKRTTQPVQKKVEKKPKALLKKN